MMMAMIWEIFKMFLTTIVIMALLLLYIALIPYDVSALTPIQLLKFLILTAVTLLAICILIGCLAEQIIAFLEKP